jgi:branched-chain amino acid transport system substrate-binding protein
VSSKLRAAVAGGLLAAAVAGCGSASSSSSGGSGADASPITIGASLSQTGQLGQFGPLIRSGYALAVQRVNQAGGVTIDGTKHKVQLKLLDNQSDPNTAAEQVKTLVDGGAVGILGAASPDINIPAASAAEALHTPFVTSFTPVTPWKLATKSQWHWAWDLFLDVPPSVQAELATANMAPTDKKIALFTDNEADGKAWGAVVEAIAPHEGYQVVMHATFAPGTTNYRSFVERASTDGAQIVIAMMAPPDGITLWKQMKALDYRPKLAFCEKCGDAGAFAKALGPLANGTNTVGLWTSAEAFPGTAAIKAALGREYPDDPDLAVAVAANTAAEVLLGAIEKAGSLDAAKINAAIGQTDETYTFGHIHFAADNVAQTPALMEQWQNGTAVQVYPKAGDAKLEFPARGLQ